MELTEPVPRVLHWGADLGDLAPEDLAALTLTAEPAILNNAPDIPRRFTVWPTEADGWSGTPAHHGHQAGTATAPRPALTGATHHTAPDGGELQLRLADEAFGLDIILTYTLDPHGTLTADTELSRPASTDTTPYDLSGALTLLPLPRRATEILDFTGKWSRERSPQRRPVHQGAHVRDVRRGKPGVDSPYLLSVGVPGFGFRTGEVWAVHVAWSGDQRYLVEQLPEGAGVHASALGGGELLRAGEIRLAPGDTYRTPRCHFAWSAGGLDGIADRFHRHLRARPQHPRGARPLVLNRWEGVYFDHDLGRLRDLAERAAAVGVERFVLDDGWFSGRRADTAGLGDWLADPAVWPDGLSPVADHVRALGMDFGLWVEPEVVNSDSRLARAHPDRSLGPAAGLGPTARHQHVLDLARPEVFDYLLKSLDALVGSYDIACLKWDHNRELHEAVRAPDDRPAGHAQVAAF